MSVPNTTLQPSGLRPLLSYVLLIPPEPVLGCCRGQQRYRRHRKDGLQTAPAAAEDEVLFRNLDTAKFNVGQSVLKLPVGV